MTELVGYELAGGIATISMNDGKANALSVKMLGAISAAFDRALADKAAVVVLAGREKFFSGGFDLGAFSRGADEVRQMLEAGARLAEKMQAFPRPVVAACSGHAIAMGVFLLLSADVRIGVDQGARIHVNEVAIGMTLPRFAIAILSHRLAPAALSVAAVTAEPHSPAQALAAGFLDQIVPVGELAAAVQARAAALAKLHAGAFEGTKVRIRQPALEALRAAIGADVEEWKTGFPMPS